MHQNIWYWCHSLCCMVCFQLNFIFNQLTNPTIIGNSRIHMSTESSAAFSNPCIPDALKNYGAYSGAFSLLAIFLTHFIQTVATQKINSLLKQESMENLEEEKAKITDQATIENPFADPENGIDNNQNLDPSSPSSSFGVSQTLSDEHHDHTHGGLLIHSNSITVYLLEFGIALHSILIGIALGVATEDFGVLLIAISVHQFFEGLGLSIIVLEANMKKKKWASWIMVATCTAF
jgi:zinc transporter 1/2/3